MFELQELIELLQKKYPELKKSEVELICRSQFRFIWEKIQSGEFKTINIKHIGKFVPKQKLKEFWINKLANEGNPEYNKQYRYGKRKEKRTKQVVTRKMFNSESMLPEELLNSKGIPMKNSCLVKVDNEYYKVKHSFQEVLNMIEPIVIKGFVNGTR